MNPAFHKDVLKRYLEVSNRYTKEYLEYLSKLDGGVQNLSSTVSKLILTIMTGNCLSTENSKNMLP